MTDTVAASLITVVGMLGTSITAGLVQWMIADSNNRNNQFRDRSKMLSEVQRVRQEKRFDMVMSQTAEVLALVDPDNANETDAGIIAKLLLSTQLHLDTSDPVECELHDRLTDLGLSSKSPDIRNRLLAADNVLRAAQEFTSNYYKLSDCLSRQSFG